MKSDTEERFGNKPSRRPEDDRFASMDVKLSSNARDKSGEDGLPSKLFGTDTDDDRERAENFLGGVCAISLAVACSNQAFLFRSLSLSGISSSKSNRSPTNDKTASYPEIRARVAAA